MLSRSVSMNKMGSEQDNSIILLEKLWFWRNCIFWEKTAILRPARVPRAGMIMKLGRELDYFGDSSANLPNHPKAGRISFW